MTQKVIITTSFACIIILLALVAMMVSCSIAGIGGGVSIGGGAGGNTSTLMDSRMSHEIIASGKSDINVPKKSISSGASSDSADAKLTILMYHNVIPDSMKPNKYEINLSNLEEDLRYMSSNGYTSMIPSQLIAYTNGAKIALPDKAVMLTFDDGFYNYTKYLLTLLDKYEMNCVISVVCGFSKFNKSTSATGRYIYMDYDDMALAQSSHRVEIAGHSNDLHWQRGGRLGANKKRGEDPGAYRKVFMNDCREMEQNLAKFGIKPLCYTYPYGAYCADSEVMLRERGYKMSLTCEEKVNRITRNPECLYKLGRYNRSGIIGNVGEILKAAYSDANS